MYLIPTPVGNLEDITLRALRLLQEVDLVLAEDTRTTGFLFKHFDIKTPMLSHHKFNEHKTVEVLAERIASFHRLQRGAGKAGRGGEQRGNGEDADAHLTMQACKQTPVLAREPTESQRTCGD